MFYLTKRMSFSASHRLHNAELSDDENRNLYGRCNNPRGHGHNYVIEVTVAGEPDPRSGMVMNLTELRRLMEENIISQVDHRHLNHDVPWLAGINPTAENLARVFWDVLSQRLPRGRLWEVRVYESENNSASYRGRGKEPGGGIPRQEGK